MGFLGKLLKAKKPAQEPQYSFDDQQLYLRYNADASLTPSFCVMSKIPFDAVLNKEFKNNLVILLDQAFKQADQTSSPIQNYINTNVAPRAKMLWAFKKIYENAPPMNEAESSLQAKIILDIYRCDDPRQFPNYLQATLRLHPSFEPLVQHFMNNVKNLSSPEADAFAKKEIALWLEQQGFPDITVSGKGDALFSDSDTKALTHYFREKISAKQKNIGAFYEEIKNLVTKKGAELTPENLSLMNEMRALPQQYKNRDLTVLFDIALQDQDFNIMFFSGHSTENSSRRYGGLSGGAGYVSSHKKAKLPKNQRNITEITYEQYLGYPLGGEFSIINNLPLTINTLDRNSAWKEELLHRAMDRLFNNETFPFSGPLQEKKYTESLAYDVQHGKIMDLLKGEVWLPNATPSDILAHIIPGGNAFDKHMYARAMAESLVKIMLKAESEGWDAAKDYAPKLTDYLQNVILPFAHEKSKEWHIQLTAPPSSPHLSPKALPGNRGPDTRSSPAHTPGS